jgi:hypothetical protein
VNEFFKDVYPINELDQKIFQSEVWPRLWAVQFNQGDVLKPYNEYTKDVFIIFEGDVDVYSKLPLNKKNPK